MTDTTAPKGHTAEGRSAIAILIDACKADFTSDATEGGPAPSTDDEPVALAEGGRSSELTFGMIRAAERELMTGTPFAESTTIRRLECKPGDMIVIYAPDRLAPSQMTHASEWIREAIGKAGGPPDIPVLILDGGKKLDLLAARPSASLAEPRSVDMIPIFDGAGRRIGEVNRSAADEIGLGRAPFGVSVGVIGDQASEITLRAEPSVPA